MNTILPVGPTVDARGTGRYTAFLPVEPLPTPADVFASFQPDNVRRTARSTRTVITYMIPRVPFTTDKFNYGLRQELDSIAERSKDRDVLRIRITANISQIDSLGTSGFPVFGAWSANAVKKYLVGKDVDPNRIIVRGQGLSYAGAPGAVEVRIFCTPR